MTENAKYWIWLQQCLGEGARFKEIIEDFGSAENLYNANIIEWKQSTALTISQVERLQKFELDKAEEIIRICNEHKWNIISFDDEAYPQRLREIPNPPAVLYVDGELMKLDDYAAIAIVGTRKASPYALRSAFVMAKGISKCGAIVISGGALGVDASAHKGALSENAKTIAVLGCGLGVDYLQANYELREQIKALGGALVTEFPPFFKPTKVSFPLRNRIISGLSLGTLIVEAGIKSGSLITAQYANEQCRDVYAIAGAIFDYNFQGSNKLLRDGAILAIEPEDLISAYKERFETLDISKIKTARELEEELIPKDANAPELPQITFDNIKKDRAEAVKRQDTALELKGNEKLVYGTLSQAFISIDEIADKAQLNTKQVLIALTSLEMKKLIESASGKRYRLK